MPFDLSGVTILFALMTHLSLKGKLLRQSRHEVLNIFLRVDVGQERGLLLASDRWRQLFGFGWWPERVDFGAG